jgi:hypothetical protein
MKVKRRASQPAQKRHYTQEYIATAYSVKKLDRYLDLIAITRKEVELDSRDDTQHNHRHNSVGRTENGRLIGRDMLLDNDAGNKRNIRLRLIGKDRHREEAESGRVYQQAGANDEPHAEAAQIVLANDGELAAGHGRPDSSQHQHHTGKKQRDKSFAHVCVDEQRR